MKYRVVMYDVFENVPLRGLLQFGETTLAFVGEDLADEPAEILGRRGVYARLWAFKCSDELVRVLQEKDELFRGWRAVFDKGDARTESHPLYTNARYRELSSLAKKYFEQLISPIFEQTGLFKIENESYVFDSLSE